MTENPTLIQRWKTLVRTRAEDRVTRMQADQPLAEAVLNLVIARLRKQQAEEATLLNVATVEGWLNGEIAPESPVIHEALLTVLGWAQTPPRAPRTLESSPTSMHAALIRAQAELSALEAGPHKELSLASPEIKPPAQEIREIYAALPPALKRAAPLRPGARSHVVPAPMKIDAPTHRFGDAPALLPLRVIESPAHFEKLTVLNCTEQMAKTANIHEFLQLYRGHEAQTLEDFAKKIGLPPQKVAALESGMEFPTVRELSSYKAKMQPGHAVSLDSLAISNSLLIRDALIKERDHADYRGRDNLLDVYQQKITACMENLPPCYWQAVIEKHQDKAGYKKHSGQFLWARKLIPIEVKEDYLRAARGCLSLSTDDVAQALGMKGVTGETIAAIENSMELPDGKVGKKLCSYYREQVKHAGGPAFDLEVLGRLKTAYTGEAVQEAPQKPKAPRPKKVHADDVMANKFLADGWPFRGGR